MKQIIHREDLGFGVNTTLGRWSSAMLMSLLGFNKLNKLYSSLSQYDGVAFAEKVLEKLDCNALISEKSLENIPEKGAFVVVSNLPHGALDALVLMVTVLKKRPDTRFLDNLAFRIVEPLSCLAISGKRHTIGHLSDGGGLIIFPSSDVSSYDSGMRRVEDTAWQTPMLKFARATGAPVIPLYITGNNSKRFHIIGKVHRKLSALMLGQELLRRRGETIEIATGAPLNSQIISEFCSINNFSNYLRANVYSLAALLAKQQQERIQGSLFQEVEPPILTPEELANPFMEWGEKKVVQRQLDPTHIQLILWTNRSIACVNIGFGERLMRRAGQEAFDSFALFEYSHKLTPQLEQTLELSNWSISVGCDEPTLVLQLLWKAIMEIATQNPTYKHILTSAAIPSQYNSLSKILIVKYLRQQCWDNTVAAMITPRHSVKGLRFRGVESSLLRSVNSVNLLSKLLSDIEGQQRELPPLLGLLLRNGAKAVSFNTDAEFADSLDALMIVDL